MKMACLHQKIEIEIGDGQLRDRPRKGKDVAPIPMRKEERDTCGHCPVLACMGGIDPSCAQALDGETPEVVASNHR